MARTLDTDDVRAMLGEFVETACESASSAGLDFTVPNGLQALIDGGAERDLSDPAELGAFVRELLDLCLQLPAKAIRDILDKIGEKFMDALNAADPAELLERFNPSKMAASRMEQEGKKYMDNMTDELLGAYAPREG